MRRSTTKKKESGGEQQKRQMLEAEEAQKIEKEKQKWCDISTRILSCIKYLVTQNLALEEHRGPLQLADIYNVGDFLGLMKLLAVFDPVMKEHLKHVESHPGTISYLSPDVQNEFIHPMASAVRQSLLRGICKAKYYGIMFDLTPDVEHSDQMSEIVRYVDIDSENNTVCVRESFLGFIQIRQKDAPSLVEDILKQLEKDGMKLQDCRSLCYDNGFVMAGRRSGFYQRIYEKNKLTLFVNPDNHSLNLVSVHAAMKDSVMGAFFRAIDSLYVFFSNSTECWEKLKNILPEDLKSESETRWSARAEAVKAVNKYIEEILTVLEDVVDDETSNARGEAQLLCKNMMRYDFITLLGFWNRVLIRIDKVQKRLQDPRMNLHDAALDLKTLRDDFLQEREVWVSESIEKGFGLCEEWNVAVKRRVSFKGKMPDEKLRDVGLTAKQEMERVMKAALDTLHEEMDERSSRLHDIDTKFGFLLNIKELCYSAERKDLKNKCDNFGEFYSSDIDGQQLYEEILACRTLLSGRTNTKISKPEELLKFIVQYGDDKVFSNLCIAIQLLLISAVSITSCERYFSKLKLIRSYLRVSGSQDRLSDLALLNVEREETEKTDFNVIIDQFASTKSRKI